MRRFCYTPPPWNQPCDSGLTRQSRFSSAVREFFRAPATPKSTHPSSSPFLIPEPAIEVFQTEYLPPRGSARPLWLVPSPRAVDEAPRRGRRRRHLPDQQELPQLANTAGRITTRSSACWSGTPSAPVAWTPSASPKSCSITSWAAWHRCMNPAAGAALSPRDDAGGLPTVRGYRPCRLPGRTTR